MFFFAICKSPTINTEFNEFPVIIKTKVNKVFLDFAQRIRIVLSFERLEDSNYCRLKTNEKIISRGHHLKLSLWKLNTNNGRRWERVLKEGVAITNLDQEIRLGV